MDSSNTFVATHVNLEMSVITGLVACTIRYISWTVDAGSPQGK